VGAQDKRPSVSGKLAQRILRRGEGAILYGVIIDASVSRSGWEMDKALKRVEQAGKGGKRQVGRLSQVTRSAPPPRFTRTG